MTTAQSVESAAPLARHPGLPRVAGECAELSRLLYGREWPPLSVGSEQLKLRFSEVLAEQAGLQMQLRCAGRDYELQVVDPFVWADYQGALAPEVPADMQRALVLHSLASLWHAVERRFGASIELLGVSVNVPAWPAMQALGMRVTRQSKDETRETALMLRAVSPQGWRHLTCAPLAPSTVSSAMDGQMFCVSAHPAAIGITLKELLQLEPGDVLVMDTPAQDRYQIVVRLMLQGRPLAGFSASLRGQQLVIESVSDAPLGEFRPRGWPMSLILANLNAAMTPNATAPSNAPLPASSLDSVQVDIELELAQISVPLSTLRALSVGQVFETSHHIDSPAVVLWCGGQRLGVGQLVAVGDRLGVRVAALNIGSADPDAPAAAAE